MLLLSVHVLFIRTYSIGIGMYVVVVVVVGAANLYSLSILYTKDRSFNAIVNVLVAVSEILPMPIICTITPYSYVYNFQPCECVLFTLPLSLSLPRRLYFSIHFSDYFLSIDLFS